MDRTDKLVAGLGGTGLLLLGIGAWLLHPVVLLIFAGTVAVAGAVSVARFQRTKAAGGTTLPVRRKSG